MTVEKDLKPRTRTFASRIIQLFCALPKTTLAQVLGKQVLRSGTSVGANYREACRARSKAEFVAKLGDCLKELDETGYWLELITENNVIASTLTAPIMAEADELMAIFTTIIKRTKEGM